MLSIEEFAARMGVKRTTIYDWLKSGHLRSGRHYIRIGGTIRFPWGPELLQRLLEDTPEEEPRQKAENANKSGESFPQPTTARKRESQINLNY